MLSSRTINVTKGLQSLQNVLVSKKIQMLNRRVRTIQITSSFHTHNRDKQAKIECCHMRRELHEMCPARSFHVPRHFFHNSNITQNIAEQPTLPTPELDFDYMVNPQNTSAIAESIENRKGVGDIHRVLHLWNQLQQEQSPQNREKIEVELLKEGLSIPNRTHPLSPVGDESNAKQVELHGSKRDFGFKPKSVLELGSKLDVLRVENVGLSTGPRTYFFKNSLAKMEQALVRFTMERLLKKGFLPISVPDMVHPAIIEGCGFKTSGERSQVYKLVPERHGQVCLAGTAEMALAGYFMNKVMDIKELPLRLVAMSRCYRAETSDVEEERGLYRVHQFTKVEMFGVTANETGTESDQLLEDLISIEKELFTEIGLHFRILDMPSQELGAPAYRKYDIETWLSAKQFWGEISSASNCTDFQSRRLNIKYKDCNGNLRHAHTVNGTACAVPRMVIAIMENNQNKDGTVDIPVALQPYMNGLSCITTPEKPTKMTWVRSIKSKKK